MPGAVTNRLSYTTNFQSLGGYETLYYKGRPTEVSHTKSNPEWKNKTAAGNNEV